MGWKAQLSSHSSYWTSEVLSCFATLYQLSTSWGHQLCFLDLSKMVNVKHKLQLNFNSKFFFLACVCVDFFGFIERKNNFCSSSFFQEEVWFRLGKLDSVHFQRDIIIWENIQTCLQRNNQLKCEICEICVWLNKILINLYQRNRTRPNIPAWNLQKETNYIK